MSEILVIEDDPDVRALVAATLERSNFTVHTAECGNTGINLVKTGQYDLIILDLGLPDVEGFDMVQSLKAVSSAGLLILSGRDDALDKALGIELGADDYLSKPFDPRELIARVKGILRRANPHGNGLHLSRQVMTFDGWHLDLSVMSLENPDGEIVELTSGEFTLLSYMVQNAGRILSRDQILQNVYGEHTPAFDRSVDVRIGRLRKKLTSEHTEAQKIKTIRNAGYLFCSKVQSAHS